MARREIALNPFVLSSLTTTQRVAICSVARAIPTAISAPPLTPQPSCNGTLQRRPGAWPASCSCSAVGAVVERMRPISSPFCTITTRPAKRRSAAPMPMGRVPPSGLPRPTRRLSPSTSTTASLIVPALMAVTIVKSVPLYLWPA